MANSLHVLAVIISLAPAILASVIKDIPVDVVIHATNRTSVPSIHHIVDAVECLREAYAVYTVDSDRAELYAQLFEEKHPESHWNVVVGYTAAYLQSKYYVEVSVSSGGKDKDDKKDKEPKKDKDKSNFYMIFSTEK